MKAIALYRVSTDKQDNQRQYDKVRDYADKNGYKLVKEFEEKISGKAKLKIDQY